jgi:hypothetical protein
MTIVLAVTLRKNEAYFPWYNWFSNITESHEYKTNLENAKE